MIERSRLAAVLVSLVLTATAPPAGTAVVAPSRESPLPPLREAAMVPAGDPAAFPLPWSGPPAGPGAARPAAAGAGAAAPPDPRPALLAPPERRLLDVLALLHGGRLEAALRHSRELVEEMPGFQLARALAADLKALAGGGAPALEWFPATGAGAHPAWEEDRRAALQAEAAQRWVHAGFRWDGRVPNLLLHVPGEVRHVLVVETDTSRLYLFRNGREGLQLAGDFYASIGRAGAGKSAEGDERTPLGVYFTLSRMDDGQLADRYGAHAFPLNYPNYWDRRLERTGRGIWLHGVPHETYSRPPRDSEGCIAITNDDIRYLARRLDPRFTPVVITRRIRWVAPESLAAPAAALLDTVQAWHRASREAGTAAGPATALFYEGVPGARYLAAAAGGRGGEASDAAGAGRAGQSAAPLRLERVSLFSYPGEPELVLATFEETRAAADGAAPRRGWRRQYWRRGGDGRWRIAVERVGGR